MSFNLNRTGHGVRAVEVVTMVGKLILFTFALLILVADTAPCTGLEERTILVPDDYRSIQAALDAASDGDSIVVRDGVYVERIMIRKRVTIRSEKGPDKCVIAPPPSYGLVAAVVNVSSNSVKIEGFTVEGSSNEIGIAVSNAEECEVVNNIVRGCLIGILFFKADKNKAVNNTLIENDFGMSLEAAGNNVITRNVFVKGGISVVDSYGNRVEENIVNGKELIYLEGVSNRVVNQGGQVIAVNCIGIIVKGLNISDTAVGIEFHNTRNSRIEANIIRNSSARDGVGDTPFEIGKAVDKYPLARPRSHYVLLHGKLFMVEVSSEKGEVSGGGLYEAGDIVTVLVTPPLIRGFLTNEVFKGWVAENGTMVSTSPAFSFTVRRSLSLEASWETQPNLMGIAVVTGAIAIVVMLLLALVKRRSEKF